MACCLRMRTRVANLVKTTQVVLEAEPPILDERKHLPERPQVQGLKLCGKFVIRPEDCFWYEVRFRVRWMFRLTFINKRFELPSGEFWNPHHFETHRLQTLFMRTIYYHHSAYITWIVCKIKPNQQSTQ